MQHVTRCSKVEGQDFVESIHPAPSSDLSSKDGRKGVNKKAKKSAYIELSSSTCCCLIKRVSYRTAGPFTIVIIMYFVVSFASVIVLPLKNLLHYTI